MALPVPAQSPGEKRVLEVLEDNNRYLEEIKATVTSDSTIIEGQYEILDEQLQIEEENQRLAALEADNAELRANRLERKLASDTGATATPVSTMSGGAARADGPGLLNALKTAFPLALAPALAAALQGGGLIGLGNMFGESIGSFLGDNIGKLITDLGVDPAFGQKVDDLLTERTGSLIVSGGWSKLLFGKARYGIIADAIAGFLGLPSLTDPAVVEEIQSNITSMFGETVGNLFGGAADVIEQGGQGLFAGSMLGSMFGRRGRVVGALAGLFIDYFDLTSLADPAKRDEIMDNVFSTIPTMLGTTAALGATYYGGRRALSAAGSGISGAFNRLLGRGGAPAAPEVQAPEPPRMTAREAARNLTPAQLEQSGLRRVGTGANAIIQRAGTGQIASNADILAAAESAAIRRYPRLAKLLRFPGIGSIISLGELYFILNDDSTSMDEKVARVAGLLGGIGGSTLGAIAGGLVGAPGGPLAIATAFVGGTAGYFAGDAIVYHIAKYLLGLTDAEAPEGLVETIAPEMQEPPGLPAAGAPAAAAGLTGATATPTSTATGGTVNTTTANMVGEGATELSAANMVGEGATELSAANLPGAGNIESSRANTIRTTSVSIASPNSVRILPQVGTNQITERSLMLGRQSGNLNIVQPVQNVTNVTNNNTSVAGGGGGGGNMPSGRSYNLDQSFNSVQRPAYA
jgi:hypothetical protein